MTVWVLIISLSWKSIATQEFTSKERCEAALAAAKEKLWNVHAVCVLK